MSAAGGYNPNAQAFLVYVHEQNNIKNSAEAPPPFNTAEYSLLLCLTRAYTQLLYRACLHRFCKQV